MRIKLLVSFLLCYSYCIHITHASPINCLEDQQSLLLQFKNNLTFDPKYSTTLKLWNNSTACCYWRGVRCDNEGHVIALYLIEEELISGGFNNSSSLFSLQHLQELYLSYNNFNSSFPSGFSKLEKLTVLDLSNCHFYGTLSNSMSNLTHLTYLDLSHNDLSGAIPSSLFTLPSLDTIYFSHNDLSGAIPSFLFTIPSIITHLDLSSNRLNGTLQLDEFLKLRNFVELNLSYNNISVNVNDSNVDQTSSTNIQILHLASCNLKSFPGFLINQSILSILDLSDNQIQGKIPNWSSKPQYLKVLNISHNFLSDFEGIMQNLVISSNLEVLDLHNNQLLGSIPQDIGNYLSSTYFLSLSNNNLHGSIPDSLCKASQLQVFDFSVNNISGTIPPCLMTMTSTLEVLNLGKNNLTGLIPDMFPFYCVLSTLNFHGNLLHGPIPSSLSDCSFLTVLDIGSNQISGGFPCFLPNIPSLSILVLRNNRFNGSIECSDSQANEHWKMIQIVDIAFNNFNGKLPEKYFTTWDRMIHNKDDVVSDFIHTVDTIVTETGTYNYNILPPYMYYQDSVTVSTKGQQLELVKILKIFTVIDFSSNHFEGPIPDVLMDFKAIHVLNLSNNALYGEIPSTIGNLQQLESLDLSNNSLVGEIPVQIASLSFLSYLNLSLNHLVGMIPTGTQIQSFQSSSFEGNDGLFGPPLIEKPYGKMENLHPQPTSGRQACSNNWNFLSVELGFISGLGIIIGPVMLWKQWRVRYWQTVDKILCWMFSRMYLEYATDRGQTYTVLRW
ncbi:unnamed protein product [Trifolium pratense]|uniref:Uncharacterized protein n=1 Tax=Trifolium pratense TaxID=57577 RepID=A0ACB0KKG2_TRIPR|nr:unnamed protein product [Trifolium pratense]